MAGLFLIYLFCLILIFKQKRSIAFGLLAINLALSLFMLWHHATDPLNIRL